MALVRGSGATASHISTLHVAHTGREIDAGKALSRLGMHCLRPWDQAGAPSVSQPPTLSAGPLPVMSPLCAFPERIANHESRPTAISNPDTIGADAPAELERATAAGEPDRGAMAKLSDDQRRALRLLAGSPNGCTGALMLAHGFDGAMLGKLVLDGLARAEEHATMAGSRPMKVVWLQITEAGRKAVAE
jgi:hypothetical protein